MSAADTGAVAPEDEVHATRAEFEIVLDAYRVLLAGYDDSRGEDPEHIRWDVMTVLVRCITRQAFTDPAHLASLDLYGITLEHRDIIPGAIDKALRLTAPVADRLSNCYWIGDIYQWLSQTSIARVGIDGEHGLDIVDDPFRRKQAAAYYTPSVLVEALLDTALEPLIDKALGYQPGTHRKGCICPRCLPAHEPADAMATNPVEETT